MSSSAVFEVTEEYAGSRLDAYLADVFEGKSRTFLQKLIKDSQVSVNEKVITKPSFSIDAFDNIEVIVPDAEALDIHPEDLPVEVLYEDEDVLVVNKPKNMVVHPSAGHMSGTIVNFVMHHCGDSLSEINGVLRPGIVHRIDKDTTGSLIICKNNASHIAIAEQIKEHSCGRVYLGIVMGRVKEPEGDIRSTIGRDPKNRLKMAMNVANGKDAHTTFRVLASNDKYSLCEFRLHTGRTHQIRVHMAGINHPLLGDELYGGNRAVDKRHLQGQTLHAFRIEFNHPVSGDRIISEAPIPEYFKKLMEEMSFNM